MRFSYLSVNLSDSMPEGRIFQFEIFFPSKIFQKISKNWKFQLCRQTRCWTWVYFLKDYLLSFNLIPSSFVLDVVKGVTHGHESWWQNLNFENLILTPVDPMITWPTWKFLEHHFWPWGTFLSKKLEKKLALGAPLNLTLFTLKKSSLHFFKFSTF